MQLLSSALFCSAHPVVLHQLPQVINQRELLWIYLMESERETHETCYLRRELKTSMRPDRTVNVFFSQCSYPPSWWWIFPIGRWHHPLPRPCGSLTLAARSAASAPLSPPPPHHCCSSHEWYPTAGNTNRSLNTMSSWGKSKGVKRGIPLILHIKVCVQTVGRTYIWMKNA